MSLSALSPRDRRALVFGTLALLASLLWMLVAAPYLQAVRGADQQLRASRDLLERELHLLAEAARYPAAKSDGAKRLEELGDRLFAGDDERAAGIALHEHLRRLAKESQVLVSELRPLPARDVGGVTSTSLQLMGESDLQGLLALLRSLELGPRVVHVDDLHVEPQSAGAQRADGAEVLAFQFTVSGFSLAGIAATGAPGVPRSQPSPQGGRR